MKWIKINYFIKIFENIFSFKVPLQSCLSCNQGLKNTCRDFSMITTRKLSKNKYYYKIFIYLNRERIIQCICQQKNPSYMELCLLWNKTRNENSVNKKNSNQMNIKWTNRTNIMMKIISVIIKHESWNMQLNRYKNNIVCRHYNMY